MTPKEISVAWLCMAVPRHSDLYRLVLEALRDGAVHHWRDCVPYIVEKLKLTPEDCQKMLPSGRRPMLFDRVQWSITYVRQAGMVVYPKRGYCQLTEEGLRVVNDASIVLDDAYMMRYDGFVRFRKGNKPQGSHSAVVQAPEQAGTDETPVERMNSAYEELRRVLESEILEEIMRKKDAGDFVFFERLVVDSVMAMGYGSNMEGAGVVTKPTGDGGIDGIVSEDKLGFNKIYIQAKCWALDSTVGSPDVHQFLGALTANCASKGLFITTGRFSAPALKLADLPHDKKLVLVDGSMLAKLMIEHSVGVSPVNHYVVKRIDSDYFNPN